jgi:16S rRNA (guanine527-N7)-methyltransferase
MILSPETIEARATTAGLVLPKGAADHVAAHARLVLESPAALHLTTIRDPEVFLERHVGEAFEGASRVDPSRSGPLVDLGSGNGYPGIPIALARPGLRVVLVESSRRKSDFLRRALVSAALDGTVLERRVQRASDLEAVAPIEVLVTRAAEGWDAVVPRLASAFRPGGTALIWSGAAARAIVTRASWRRRFELVGAHELPGRATFIYELIVK